MGSVGIKFNDERAKNVLAVLDRMWRENTGIFRNIILPQDRRKLPEEPVEQARYLFFSALFMRGGVISEDPFRWLFPLYEERPEYFDPDYISEKLSPAQIEEKFVSLTPNIVAAKKNNGSANSTTNSAVMRQYRLFGDEYFIPSPDISKKNGNEGSAGRGSIALKIKEHCSAWCHNSAVLSERWQSDPLRIYDGVGDFEEAFARIDYRRNQGSGIIGMRRKIFSLFTIWLQEKRLIPHFPCPVPVDFHALRVLAATEIISLPVNLYHFDPSKHPAQLKDWETIRVAEEFINEIMFWSENFIVKNRLDHLNVNPALWVLSRDLCANQYQNIARDGGQLYVDTENLRSRPSIWPSRYRDPCQFCPIEVWCGHILPAAPYYDWGLLAREERIAYERTELLFPKVSWRPFAKMPKRLKSTRQ